MKQYIKSGLLLGIIALAAGVVSMGVSQRTAMAADGGGISDQDIGKDIYEVRCSTCHGPGGDGNVGHTMPYTAPPLKGDQFVISAPDKMIAEVIRHGRTGARRHFDDTYPDMPSFDASLIEDIRPLIAYLKGDMQK
jgi:mono/diheme cytochrome c family protein